MFSEVQQLAVRLAQSPIRPMRTVTLIYDFGIFDIEEHDMRTVWPVDLLGRDNETLVLFTDRKGNPNYEPI